jgi:hypothetical protein
MERATLTLETERAKCPTLDVYDDDDDDVYWPSYKVSVILENCTLLGYYAASSGNLLPTFRDNLLVSLSGFKIPKGFVYLDS